MPARRARGGKQESMEEAAIKEER
jgi:hypothetical protein